MAADQEHRDRLQRLRAQAAKEISDLWRVYYDPDDIEGSWQRFGPVAVPVVMAAYDRSSVQAQEYLDRIRAEQDAPGRNFPAPPLEQARVESSLGYVARVGALLGLWNGRSPQQAADVALVRTMGATQRFVNEGSTGAVRETLSRDPQATGWRRIAAPTACDFCSGLAANGVYSYKVDFSAHDHCGCTASPVFGERPTRPSASRRADRRPDRPASRPRPASDSFQDRVAAQRTFAEGSGWDVTVQGRQLVGVKDTQRIVWELTESGTWRVESLARS